jgi:hypothetical protein
MGTSAHKFKHREIQNWPQGNRLGPAFPLERTANGGRPQD